MKPLKCISLFAAMLYLLVFPMNITGQVDIEILEELAREEQEAVSALILYPKDTRIAILEASQYPEALIKIESIQKQSREAFLEIMEPLSQESQEMIWDLTRYPDLIEALVAAQPNSDYELKFVLSEFPEIIHKRAEDAYYQNYETLIEIHDLDLKAKSAFGTLLLKYDEDVQESLSELIALPEVLTILLDNIRMTILVGEVYQDEPEWLLHKVDSLSLEMARQNAREVEDWKKELKENPEALEELNASSESYAESYEYDDDDYYDEYEYGERRTTIHYFNEYPYPYWYGYPYWYTYPRWRHYPHWYDWGFYYGPHRTIIIVGLPSFHFTSWYFHHHQHHAHWPHLSAHFVNHYYGHRTSLGSVTTGVTNWKEKNRDIVSKRFLNNDGKLADRFKEFGEYEMDRSEYNRKNPNSTVSQKEYITRSKKQYPGISKSIKEVQAQQTVQANLPSKKARRKTTKKHSDPKTVPANKVEKQTPIKKTPIYKKKKEEKKSRTKSIPKVNNAKDYHKSTWEKSKKTRKPSTTKAPVRKQAKKKSPPKRKPPKEGGD